MPIPYLLLCAAIAAVWMPALRFGARGVLPPWVLLFGAATGTGLAQGVLSPPALAPILALCIAGWAHRSVESRKLGAGAGAVVTLIAIALAAHRLPGFHNFKLLDGLRLSPGSIAFHQLLNFDKGVAGLFVLAAFGRRTRKPADLGWLLKPSSAAILVITPSVVLGLGWASGLIRFEPKLPAVTLTFLAANLFFTCVAEEAFFRGVIQEQLMQRTGGGGGARWLPVMVSALLFAGVHAGGGNLYMGLVAIAGLGYALAYALSRRIESAIASHFALNAVHFLLFTYPLASH